MSVYTAVLSLGFAIGPLILAMTGTSGFSPYLVGSALALVASVFILSPKVPAPKIETPPRGNLFRYIRLAPLALAATALNAAIETSGLTFLHIYAISLNWSEEKAVSLMTCIMVGAIILQLPIGWLGDKVNRSRLVLCLAVISALIAALWPLVMFYPLAVYAFLFLFGGSFVGIYVIMLTIVGSRFKGAELLGVYAASGLFWGLGALIGPLIAGLFMELFFHGFPFYVCFICLAFIAAWFAIKDKT
jgi:MFS family permease